METIPFSPAGKFLSVSSQLSRGLGRQPIGKTATLAFSSFLPLPLSFQTQVSALHVGASGAYRKTLSKNTNSLKLPLCGPDLNLVTL